ncbi:MAG: N-acetylglucosamine-6-phosphate deacetylase [Candidatus Omnitrophica bacterium]|nr:N-acetylglucosamine-6-phosphate deacetylase [Candidatus Omnitrophota bacterium]MBU4479443.1 N-acetylglucosamine-6-phosphate deacetylase [Candidatus Omnitrophota bacterium]MCG2703519.1 N-acetylglucosamine-6-phosphate deacetylase [Candidatus Omnitrophota bacterium]
MSFRRKPRIFIHNARLVTHDAVVKDAWVLIGNGIIEATGTGRKSVPKGAALLDAGNNYLAPGFIDLHIHGDAAEISLRQARYGTTAFLFAIHTGAMEGISRALQRMKEAAQPGARCLGAYLEGPFISKDMAGAQPKKFIITPQKNAARRLLRIIGSDVKIVTVACELPGALSFIRSLRKRNIVAALGHTNASYEQARKAFSCGITHATHMFNRMSGISSREPGVSTALMLDDTLTTEVIADARHVHPALLRLLVKNRPKDKIVLVTDSVGAMGDDSLKMINGVFRMKDDTIAGSNLNMAKAVKNMVNLTDVSLPDAVRMASANPARVIGLDKKMGKISRDYDADLIIFDERFDMQMTMVKGEIVYVRDCRICGR